MGVEIMTFLMIIRLVNFLLLAWVVCGLYALKHNQAQIMGLVIKCARETVNLIEQKGSKDEE